MAENDDIIKKCQEMLAFLKTDEGKKRARQIAKDTTWADVHGHR